MTHVLRTGMLGFSSGTRVAVAPSLTEGCDLVWFPGIDEGVIVPQSSLVKLRPRSYDVPVENRAARRKKSGKHEVWLLLNDTI